MSIDANTPKGRDDVVTRLKDCLPSMAIEAVKIRLLWLAILSLNEWSGMNFHGPNEICDDDTVHQSER
jgi:hypothetical protein